MKTEILKIKGDWIEVASDCRSTVGKPPLDHEPSVDFKKKILIAEHSPIRDISVKWTWRCMRSSLRFRMCWCVTVSIAGDVRKCIRAERTRAILMC